MILAGSSAAQRVPSNCTAPDSVLKLFREDAAKVAFARQLQLDSAYLKMTGIRQSLQDTFLRAIVAVYNSGSKASNVIFGKTFIYDPTVGLYGTIFVHYDELFSLQYFDVILDTTVEWEQNLLHNRIPTGNTSIDSILVAYGIMVDTFYDYYTNGGQAILQTSGYYNLLPIVDKWNNEIARQDQAQVENNYDYGSNISQTISDSSITLTFEYAWGDCPSGCIWHHSWTFEVFPDCSVRYIGEDGNDVGMNWSVKPQQPEKLTLTFYPNPSRETLLVETNPLSTLDVLTFDGKVIQHITCHSDKEEVSVARLLSGTYLVREIGRDGSVRTAKFIKN
jgi:hypothetical protein